MFCDSWPIAKDDIRQIIKIIILITRSCLFDSASCFHLWIFRSFSRWSLLARLFIPSCTIWAFKISFDSSVFPIDDLSAARWRTRGLGLRITDDLVVSETGSCSMELSSRSNDSFESLKRRSQGAIGESGVIGVLLSSEYVDVSSCSAIF